MASYHDELSTPAESPGGRRSLVALGALIAGLGALAVLTCTSGDEGSRRPQGEKPAEGTGGLLEVGEEEENEIIEVGVGEINPDPHAFQIGRASCRERVEMSWCAVPLIRRVDTF